MQNEAHRIGLCGFPGLFGNWLSEQLNTSGQIRVILCSGHPDDFSNPSLDIQHVLLWMRSMNDMNNLKHLRSLSGIYIIVCWTGPAPVEADVVQLMNSGSAALISDQFDIDAIKKAILDVASTGYHHNDMLTTALLQFCKRTSIQDERARAGMQFRERDIRLIELKKSGKTSKEIGEILFLSKKTVENIFYNLYRKFECRNFFELNLVYEKYLVMEV